MATLSDPLLEEEYFCHQELFIAYSINSFAALIISFDQGSIVLVLLLLLESSEKSNQSFQSTFTSNG
jgi:hypothetical protein